jgi:glycosyltransferase involved in cell wall biosynthesis
MYKVLINGLLLNNQFTGVQYYAENLMKAFSSANNLSLEINILLSKKYKGHLKANKILNINDIAIDTSNRIQRITFEHFRLAKYYKQHNFQLYHAPGYILPYFWNSPSIVTIHDLIALDYPEFCQRESVLYFNLFLPRSIKTATKIIAVSNKVKNDIINHFGISPDKIEVIYHGVDESYKKVQSEDILNRIRNKYQLPKQFLLFVGNIEPKKNLERLIEAFYQLKQQTDIKHKLVLVGKNGWRYKSLYDKISRFKLDDEILFTGYAPQQDLPSIYSLADLFVFPSLYEGFGIPPLEAMACETPVLISNQGALPEITGDNCLQVNPFDINDIAKGINTLLTNENAKKKMIENCKKWVKDFTWERAASQTMQVYEEVLSKNVINKN